MGPSSTMDLANTWTLVQCIDEDGTTVEVHVVPEADLYKHHLEDCWCQPHYDVENDVDIWVHNAADGRNDYDDNIRRAS